MKSRRLTAVVMAVSFALTFPAAVFASDTDAEPVKVDESSLNWEDAEAKIDAAEMDGDYIIYDDIAARLWVPVTMKDAEITEEQEDEGYIDAFEDSTYNGGFSVVLLDSEEMTLETYEEYLKGESDVKGITRIGLNDLECTLYQIPSQKSISAVFETEYHHILEFTFAPYTEDSDFYPIANFIIASIQPDYEDETE